MYVNIDSELDSDFPHKQPTDPSLVIHPSIVRSVAIRAIEAVFPLNLATLSFLFARKCLHGASFARPASCTRTRLAASRIPCPP